MHARTDAGQPIILFDGVCNLCNRAVRLVVALDRSKRFHFASRQSEFGRRLLDRHDLDAERDDSIVLVDGDRVLLRSTAALHIARRLKWPWPLLFGLILIPRVLRDGGYNWSARHRYRWFGRSDSCPLSQGDLDGRFLA